MRTRETLSSLIEGRLSSPDGRSELVQLATRLILEEALEAEARDALGRDYYERGAEDGPGLPQRVPDWSPQDRRRRDRVQRPADRRARRPLPVGDPRTRPEGRTEALEGEPWRANGPSAMANAAPMLARGLSVRDIEDAFRADDGQLLLSRTAVSELGPSGSGDTTRTSPSGT